MSTSHLHQINGLQNGQVVECLTRGTEVKSFKPDQKHCVIDVAYTQGRSPNVIKMNFHTIRNCSKRKEFAPSGSKFFPLRKVHILKRNAIEENHCLIQWSPFGVRIFFFSIVATPLLCCVLTLSSFSTDRPSKKAILQ